MTTTNDPDAIREQIDLTRGRLSDDVEQLSASARPSSIAQRTARRATSRAAGLKETVMGSAHDVADSGADQASGAGDAVRAAPQMARQRTRGNPLAAGAVALAAGWLVGSLLPATDAERQAAASAKEQAKPLIPEAKAMAQETVENLKEPAQQAATSVQDSAKHGVKHVKEEASGDSGHSTPQTGSASYPRASSGL